MGSHAAAAAGQGCPESLESSRAGRASEVRSGHVTCCQVALACCTSLLQASRGPQQPAAEDVPSEGSLTVSQRPSVSQQSLQLTLPVGCTVWSGMARAWATCVSAAARGSALGCQEGARRGCLRIKERPVAGGPAERTACVRKRCPLNSGTHSPGSFGCLWLSRRRLP